MTTEDATKCTCGNKDTIFGCQCHIARAVRERKRKSIATANEIRAQIATGLLHKNYVCIYKFVRKSWSAAEIPDELFAEMSKIAGDDIYDMNSGEQ